MKKNADKALAQAEGRSTYIGKPCKNCAGMWKFVRNSTCVVCATARRQTPAYKEVVQQHTREYVRRPEVRERRRIAGRLRQCTPQARAYVASRRELIRQRGWQRRGLPEPTRPRPSLCEVCGGPPGHKALALDHDHVSGEFCGWACNGCNFGIGHFMDDPQRLRQAAAYLERFESQRGVR